MAKVTKMVPVTTEVNLTPAEVIKRVGGKFFSVEFVKKDGSIRNMTCRRGVVKYTNGGTSTVAHIPNLVTVYDTQAKGYRNINLDTVKRVRAGSMEYTF